MRVGVSETLLAGALALGTPLLSAETLRGYIWEIQGSTIVVDERRVELVASTRIERRGDRELNAYSLRTGWEVEIHGDTASPGVLTARHLRVLTRRSTPFSIDGSIEKVGADALYVDGWPIGWPPELARHDVEVGMRLSGRGAVHDDGTITLRSWKLEGAREDRGERKFLDKVAPELAALRTQLDTAVDPAAQEYVTRVGRRVAPEARERALSSLSFYVVADPNPNAFAIPDGTVVVHRGLLAVLQNEAQLASVLGHEIAHVTHKHAYRSHKAHRLGAAASVVARLGYAVMRRVGPFAPMLFSLGSSLATSAAVNGYGRNLEDEADRVGLRYAYEAGYDPYESVEVWRLLSTRAADSSQASNWFFGDHATHRARISHLTREINRRYRGTLRPGTLERNEDGYRAALTPRGASS